MSDIGAVENDLTIRGLEQTHDGIERRRDLPPQVFWPRPKVRSAVVRIRPDPERRDGWGDWRALEAFLRAAFHHRRKTLRQGLAAGGGGAFDGADVSAALGKLGLEASVRAESVPAESLVALWRELGAPGHRAAEA